MDNLAFEHGIHADDLLYSHLPEVATLRYIRNLPNRLIQMGRYFLNKVDKRNSLLSCLTFVMDFINLSLYEQSKVTLAEMLVL